MEELFTSEQFVIKVIFFICTETFTENEQLSVLDLSDNNLSEIPHNAIKLHGPFSSLDLSANEITNVTFGSVSG